MRLLLPILLIFCLFSVADAGFFDDILQQYDDYGENACKLINRDRHRADDEATMPQKIYIGFLDGFLDCEHRDSNTNNTGLRDFGNSLYGVSGQIGVLLRRVLNLRQ